MISGSSMGITGSAGSNGGSVSGTFGTGFSIGLSGCFFIGILLLLMVNNYLFKTKNVQLFQLGRCIKQLFFGSFFAVTHQRYG
jgi:hypothetical protein